ncbi:MAG: metal-dependent hydrolase [Candidatus Methanospirareceae archaeon]
MFLFGHLGITLGIAVLLLRVWKIEPDRQLYGAILLGSVLPDLIDKPIGRILLAESLANGRLIAHTLLFALILVLIGLYVYNRLGEFWGLLLGGAALLHLCEDQMWLIPETLLYPLFGLAFPQGVVEPHWWEYFIAAVYRTYSLAPDAAFTLYAELLGMTVLALFAGQQLTLSHRNAQEAD